MFGEAAQPGKGGEERLERLRRDDMESSLAHIHNAGRSSTEARDGFHVRVGGGPRAAGRARRELSRLRADLDPRLMESMRLLVTELVTNSVRHAGAASVGLAVAVSTSDVRVEVSNQGAAFQPPPPGTPGGAAGGWGLFLVERLADDWGVDDSPGVTRVWFEISRA